MFGKFKKKVDSVETPSKQKNDLFTLLEETPNSNSKVESPKDPPKKENQIMESTKKIEAILPYKKNKVDDSPKVESQPPPEKRELKTDNLPMEKMPSLKTIEQKKSVSQTYPESSIKGDSSQVLLLEIEKLPDKTIKPVVDFNESNLFYPILSKIGESPDNISYLDELVTEGVLTKQVFEKLIICPVHPHAYSSSVRLYCPKCNSLNVDKLNLYEHKRCGYITESTSYDFAKEKNPVCPSCKKQIVDFKKEIRMPAMWHQCLDCHDKFDNAIVKLYCRQFEHDFETNSGQFVTTYSYKLKDYDAPITSDDDKLQDDLEQLLGEFNFKTEFKTSIKGKSGNSHKIPIYAKNNSTGETIAIFVNRSQENLSQSDVNSILVPILDVGPRHTLLLAKSGVDEDVKPVAKQYGINVISDPDLSRIIQHVDDFVSERYSRNGEK